MHSCFYDAAVHACSTLEIWLKTCTGKYKSSCAPGRYRAHRNVDYLGTACMVYTYFSLSLRPKSDRSKKISSTISSFVSLVTL